MIRGNVALELLQRETHWPRNSKGVPQPLLENWDSKWGENAGLEMRILRLYEPKGCGLLGVAERATPDLVEVGYTAGKASENPYWELWPNRYYVAQTVEKIHMPLWMTGYISPRSTLYRSGVTFHSGNIAPGYEGTLFFGLCYEGSGSFAIEQGARFALVTFYEVVGHGQSYGGQWQGGRATTKGELETQV